MQYLLEIFMSKLFQPFSWILNGVPLVIKVHKCTSFFVLSCSEIPADKIIFSDA